MTNAEKNLTITALRILQDQLPELVDFMRQEIGGENAASLEAVDVENLIERLNFGDEDPGKTKLNGGYLIDDAGLLDQGLEVQDEAGTTVDVEQFCAIVTFPGCAYLITDGGRIVRAENDGTGQYLTSTAVGVNAGEELPADVVLLARAYETNDDENTAIFDGPALA